jgi:ABC-type sugar transport system permease subunit
MTSSSTASRGRERRAGGWAPYAFVLPLLAVFAAFYLWPVVVTLVSSLFRWSLLNPWSVTEPDEWDFVGIENYTSTLTSDEFWSAVVNTMIWIVLFPLGVVVLSLFISLLVWHLARAGGLFRSVFILPMTISLAAAGVIWGFMYNPDSKVGVINAVLETLGIDVDVDWWILELHTGDWLSNPGVIDLGFAEIRLINVALVIAGVWAFTGFGVITITAGLAGVPTELIEAAKVDGATTWQTVRRVLIPQLRGPMGIVTVISFIFALRTFDIVYVMTEGGPANSTTVVALLLWQQTYVFLDSPQAGAAAATAVIMSAVVVAVCFPQLKRLLARSR